MLVIADAKRGDIGSTSAAYSAAWIGRCGGQPVFDADFVTVNPYLGTDGIAPFLEDCRRYDKGIFILVKTSNPSSSELQDLRLADGRAVYEAVADRVAVWGEGLTGSHGYSAAGAEFVEPDAAVIARMGYIPVEAPLLSDDDWARHAPDKLADAILRIVEEERKIGL